MPAPQPAANGRRLGIKAKLLGLSLILLAFTAVIGVLGIRTASQAEVRSEVMYDKVVVALKDLGVARAKFNENRAFLNNHILEPDTAAKKELEGKLAENAKLIDENLDELSHTLTTAEGKAAFAALREHLGDYRGARKDVLELSSQGQDDEAYALNKAELLLRGAAFHGDAGYYKSLYAGIKSVTAADVKRVATKYFTPGRVVLSIVPMGMTDEAAKPAESRKVTVAADGGHYVVEGK